MDTYLVTYLEVIIVILPQKYLCPNDSIPDLKKGIFYTFVYCFKVFKALPIHYFVCNKPVWLCKYYYPHVADVGLRLTEHCLSKYI